MLTDAERQRKQAWELPYWVCILVFLKATAQPLKTSGVQYKHVTTIVNKVEWMTGLQPLPRPPRPPRTGPPLAPRPCRKKVLKIRSRKVIFGGIPR